MLDSPILGVDTADTHLAFARQEHELVTRVNQPSVNRAGYCGSRPLQRKHPVDRQAKAGLATLLAALKQAGFADQ